MEAESRRTDLALTERLRRESRRFDFEQAAVLLQRLCGATNPRPVRYIPRAALSYPSAAVELEAMPDADEPGLLRIAYTGLAGLLGPLPAHYAELVAARDRSGDPTLGEFLGIFDDRCARLHLMAHRSRRFWLQFAWLAGRVFEEKGAPRDPFTEVALALVGTAPHDTRWRAGIAPRGQVHYAGLLAQRPCSASALANMVWDIFGSPAKVGQFRGRWIPIPPEARSSMGRSRIGHDFVLGERFYDPCAAFRLSVGPMRLADALALMPGRADESVFQEFVRLAAGPDCEFDFLIEVAAEDVPPARLTTEPDAPQRLGWTFWPRASDEPRSAVSGPFHARSIDASAR